jgi:WD40 repeat protein
MCQDAVFSRDAKYLFSSAGSPEWTVRRLDMKTRDEVALFRIGKDGFPGSLNYLRLSPDGSTLAMSGYAGILFLDLRKQEPTCRLEIPTLAPNACTFSPDGTRFALGNGVGVELWDLRSKTRLAVMPTVFGVNAIAFSPDEHFLVVGGMHAYGTPGLVEVFGLGDHKALATFTCHANSIATVRFIPGSTEFFTTGFDGVVKIWDLRQWISGGKQTNNR